MEDKIKTIGRWASEDELRQQCEELLKKDKEFYSKPSCHGHKSMRPESVFKIEIISEKLSFWDKLFRGIFVGLCLGGFISLLVIAVQENPRLFIMFFIIGLMQGFIVLGGNDEE